MNNEPTQCVVYWDYQNMPLQNEWLTYFDAGDCIKNIKDQIREKVGKIPISIKVYTTNSNRISDDIQNTFDSWGITVIYTSNLKESVDKRIILDCAFSLYQLQKLQERNAIILITSDKDYSFLFQRIHKESPMMIIFCFIITF